MYLTKSLLSEHVIYDSHRLALYHKAMSEFLDVFDDE